MSFADFRTGAVIRFPYLWAREAARGETEGRKPRPGAVGVRIPKPKCQFASNRGSDALLMTTRDHSL
ncbi:MAG: hypothetical protein KGJ79_13860 [Alphaproteobacteria bacterium]|nr:hypothetical protein [Alphaproteobacteria bacterium]MDE2112225.1 hypothetical protein [Alphaproteobacteria bacterium]MDE2494157.1 hypothetical protein [Alphaproteobacteria bacterium]